MIPQHVAVIMDGNGRWARRRALPRHAGHRAGVKSVRAVVEHSARLGIQHLTLFAFSSENWRRPDDEVSKLMSLFVEALQREVDELHRNEVKLEFVGDRSRLSASLQRMMADAETATAENDGLHLTVAVAYGGRWDIVEAAKRCARRAVDGEIEAESIDEDMLAEEMQLAGLPDPDLLIRTGGEQRVSNFLLWNFAYSELWFCDALWPDFREKDLDLAVEFFARRQRRYGHTGDQLEAAEC